MFSNHITHIQANHSILQTGLLSNMPDAPKELYIEGNEQLLHTTQHIYVCVVGPRKSTAYGKDVTTTILKHLSQMHVITVSGAAYGIDSIVHALSIEYGIPTIAIPGSGIDDDVFYPRVHLDLKHRIIEHGGLIMSEFNPLARASPWTFPVRNRLMAGMSHLTIVIEAEQSSGTLITAHLATDYGREVIAIPGSIYSPSSRGTHELISKGATIFTSIDTLTEVLTNIAKIQNIELWKHPVEIDHDSEVSEKSTHISLCDKEKQILECVTSFPEGVSKERIAEHLSMSSMDVSIYVTILELHGLVKISLGRVCVNR